MQGSAPRILLLGCVAWAACSNGSSDPADSAPFEEQVAAARALALPEPTIEELEAWRAWVLPTPDEVTFESVPWIPSFAEGLRAAERAGRPLFLWAMNGHPLGCT